jgi:hypothetical protein
MYKDEIEEINMTIAGKCRIQAKLEDELEQYRIKIQRADQFVCIENLNFLYLFTFK